MGHLFTGTPGRVISLIERKHLSTSHIKTIVLFDVDHMFDIGFKDALEKFLGRLERSVQKAMVSGILTEEVQDLAEKYLWEPVLIEEEEKQKSEYNLK